MAAKYINSILFEIPKFHLLGTELSIAILNYHLRGVAALAALWFDHLNFLYFMKEVNIFIAHFGTMQGSWEAANVKLVTKNWFCHTSETINVIA